MKFIDLFAGLGGFHHGMSNAGGFECVFASELDPDLRSLYYENHGIEAAGDITKIDETSIPKHEVLCAGFPCQPFSKAGKKKGAKCPKSGMLIHDILRIVKYHEPRFVLLENVPNILTIEDGKFWKLITSSFKKLGYKIDYQVFSPLEFDIPQNRKRVYVVCCKHEEDLGKFKWPEKVGLNSNSLNSLLDINPQEYRSLEPSKLVQLDKWQELLFNCGEEYMKQLSIVAPEFGATYPKNFSGLTLKELRNYKGAYGQSLSDCRTWESALKLMPKYVFKNRRVPDWLIQSIDLSRNLYEQNKEFLDKWKESIDRKNNSWQILEWRGYSNNLNIKDHNIQFRASGIRILKTEKAPSLIAMTPTQIPIIGSQMRYLTDKEGSKLQHLQGLKKLPDGTAQAFKALGNAVNARIIELISRNLSTATG